MAKRGTRIILRGEDASNFARSFGISLGKDRNWQNEEQYQCKCTQCERIFFGHKCRVVCRDCNRARELALAESKGETP